jgi:hypothetical protein
MRSAPLNLSALLLVALSLAACGGDAAPAGPGGLAGADFDLDWSTDVAYTLGGFEAIDWDAFGDVAGVGFDRDGNLYVLDSQAASIHVVGPNGERIRTFGRQGEGPGELNQPESMVVLKDGTVAVYDFGKFGWVKYGPDGEWIEDVTSPDPGNVQLLGNFSVAGEAAVLAEVVGRIRMSRGGDDADAEGGEPEEPGDPLVRLTLDEGLQTTTVFRAWDPPEPDGPERELSAGSESGNMLQFRMPQLRAFEPQLSFAGLPGGGFVALDSTTYRVEVFDAAGEPVGTITRPISPTPVTPAIEDTERARRLAVIDERARAGREAGGVRLVGGGGLGGNFSMPDMNEMQREGIANMVFWPEIPVVEDLGADWSGRIWVQRSAGRPGVDGPTDIVLADETYVGTLPADGLRIPDAFGPNGLAAWIETDEYEAQRIVVARIVESSPSTE